MNVPGSATLRIDSTVPPHTIYFLNAKDWRLGPVGGQTSTLPPPQPGTYTYTMGPSLTTYPDYFKEPRLSKTVTFKDGTTTTVNTKEDAVKQRDFFMAITESISKSYDKVIVEFNMDERKAEQEKEERNRQALRKKQQEEARLEAQKYAVTSAPYYQDKNGNALVQPATPTPIFAPGTRVSYLSTNGSRVYGIVAHPTAYRDDRGTGRNLWAFFSGQSYPTYVEQARVRAEVV